MNKIVFLGDSVTLGVGYGGVTTSNRFSSLIGASAGYAAADIINAGVGGNNSADALARLQTDVIDRSPSVCVIMLGNNDCYGSAPKNLTVAQYKSNITSIAEELRENGIKVVLFSPMYPTGTSVEANKLHPYLKALEEVVGVMGIPYVDLVREYAYMIDRGEWGIYGHVDNVHPSAAGHAFIAEYATRPKHAGFFVADPIVIPEPIPNTSEPSALLLAVTDYVLATGNSSLTAGVLAAKEAAQTA